MLFIFSAENFLSMSGLQQDEELQKFCKKASKSFYLTYFILFICLFLSFILLIVMLSITSDKLETRNMQNVNTIEKKPINLTFSLILLFTYVIFLLCIIVIGIHPLWTIKFLTFPVPDKDLSPEIKERMDKLIRKRESIKKLRKRISIPILHILLLAIVFFIISKTIIFLFKFETKVILLEAKYPLFNIPTLLSGKLVFFIGLVPVWAFIIIAITSYVWQFPYLISSLWKFFTAKWYNPTVRN